MNRPTIRDVAKAAGVSIATVSFVLNNRPGQVISERVRRKVFRAAERLNYHPTASAAGLASKRTHNIALVFYREDRLISNQFYSFVVQGAIKQAIKREYNLLFSYIDKAYKGYADLPKVIREKNAEGALFIQHIHPKLINDIQARDIPVVAIDQYPPMKRINSLQMDSHQGGQLVAEHLTGLGHTRVGLLVAGNDRPSIKARVEGFRSTLEDHGVRFSARTDTFVCKSLTFEAGYDRALAVFKRARRPSAIFCVNDEMAAGTLRAAHESGLSVPRQLSVVGFDNITMANYTDPPLTTVAVADKENLGAQAIDRLIELVEGNAGTTYRRDTLPMRLFERGSTARADDGSK